MNYKFLKYTFVIAAISYNLSVFADENKAEDNNKPVDVNALIKECEKYKTEATALKGLYQEQLDTLKVREQQIKQLKNDITSINQANKKEKQVEAAKTEELYKILISDASNYLYLPYHEISVEHKAIRSYEATKDSELYTKHIIRLELLKNYKKNIADLFEYNNQVIAATRYWMSDTKKVKGTQDELNRLKSLPLYQQYIKYDDWKNTWLGKRIAQVINLLSNTANPDIYIKKNLEEINNELKPFINK